jgi:competence protein ComFC
MKKSDFRKIWENFLDFIWPNYCLGCHQEGTLCCQTCLDALKNLPLDYQAWENQADFYFEHCYVCLDYHQDLVKNLIKNFKYRYLQNINNILVNILAQQAKKLNLPANTIITNIPLHSQKKKQRGFDQTYLLAKNLAEKLDLEYQPLLRRVKKTKIQAQLSKQERQENVSNAFVINKVPRHFGDAQCRQVRDCKIILIDDIATTGATLDQAAKVLKDNNFSNIIALVLAKN